MEFTMKKRTIKLINTMKKRESNYDFRAISLLPSIMWDKHSTCIVWFVWCLIIEIDKQ